MEEAAAVRRATEEAIQDVVPGRLQADILDRVDAMPAAPGVLTLLSARTPRTDPPDGVVELAAGIQLVYEGLRLTRQLAHEEPWARGDREAGDLAIVAADVLVARGFFLLARTEAAQAAVSMLQAFGHDQSYRVRNEEPPATAPDFDLDVDVLELAVLTGQAAADQPLPDEREARAFAQRLVDEQGGRLPTVADVLSESTRERLDALLADGVRTSPE
jgi:hypothetical protein